MSSFTLGPYSPVDVLTLVLLTALVVITGVFVWRLIRKSRLSPEEFERRRRLALAAAGKMGDATVVEIRDDLIFYSYDIRGIGYLASQDVSALREKMGDPASAVGPVAIKYDARNPANSIVIAEEWSGIRKS
jgi:hypothetical protein